MSIVETSSLSSRIWCEFVGYEQLERDGLLERLAARNVGLLLAVTPRQRPTLPRAVQVCARAGVSIGIWPMLEDTDGRWFHAGNASKFARFVRELLSLVPVTSLAEVVFDLEPPIDVLRQLARMDWKEIARCKTPAAPAAAVDELRRIVREVRSCGLIASAAALPAVLWDPTNVVGFWQRRLRTPVDAVFFDCVYVMLYTSLLEGYSRGFFSRQDAKWMLRAHCVLARQRYGDRASVSIGISGPGALGDERPYRNVPELEEDIAIVRSAGLRDVALHGLAGVLARGGIDRWLDALCSCEPRATVSMQSMRGRALLALGRAVSRLGS